MTTALAQDSAPRELVVYAAGSLRGALSEFARGFEASPGGAPVRFVFGASGLLKDRILAGEAADVFASANMEHPQAVAQARMPSPAAAMAVERFTRNRLCVLAHPEAGVTAANVIDRLIDPAVKLGTSTPGADPSGDYAWVLFRKIEQRGGRWAGSYAALDRKALQLTGGPASPPPPAGRSVYGALVESRQADAFVTYCTNALQARQGVAGLVQVDLPEDVAVAADYGVLAVPGADAGRGPAGRAFIEALLGSAGQAVLRQHGFAPR